MCVVVKVINNFFRDFLWNGRIRIQHEVLRKAMTSTMAKTVNGAKNNEHVFSITFIR